jgi:hypothetical protein
MRPTFRVTCAFIVALVLGACGGPEPLGPTPLDQGIVIYMHSGFRGTSQIVPSDTAKLRDVQGPCGTDEDESSRTWNDCISSVRVFPGWAATLYGDSDFRGATLEVTEDIVNLGALRGSCDGSYDDCISSIRVYRR